MADILDLVQDRIEGETAALIDARVIYDGESADVCQDCWALIPSARQIAVPGVQTCIDCATVREARR